MPFMNKREPEEFRKMAAQLDGLHSETAASSKKSPDKPVSKFKINLANSILEQATKVLGPSAPSLNFDKFNPDDLPSNSDLSFVVTQFVECVEKVRCENIDRFG